MRHPVVSREDWLNARAALLVKEKALMKAQDALGAEQRALPWIEITTPYVFQDPDGPVTFAELFGGKSQLFVHHFMISSAETTQCVGCSLEVDHTVGLLEHLAANDITYACIAPVEVAVIEALKAKMDWRMPFVSSLGTSFSRDIREGFVPPGAWPAYDSVFYRDEDGRIFLTWSTSGRGAEAFAGIYRYIDVTPKGRQESRGLTDWARPRPDYGQGGEVANNGRYHPPACGCAAHDAQLA